MTHIGFELPDEMWIKILKYISLEDRIKNIQFVNKRFYVLSHDRMLLTSLDFETCIFMCDRLCLNILKKAKPWINRLSFYRCHWFTGSMLSRIPKLVSLRSLDLRGCTLTPIQLDALFGKIPHVKHLAISISCKDITELCKLTVKEQSLQLSTLYVDLINIQSNKDWTLESLSEIFTHENAYYVSFDFSGVGHSPVLQWCQELIKLSGQGKKLSFSSAIDFGFWYCEKEFHRSSSIPILCKNAIIKDKSLKLENFKYLMLNVWDITNGLPHSCNNDLEFPSALPNVQYLSQNLRSGTRCRKCLNILQAPFFICEFPNLRCLNIKAKYDFIPPHLFYINLCMLENLEELCLEIFNLDYSLMAAALKSMPKLKALSITLSEINNADTDAIEKKSKSQNKKSKRISKIAEVYNTPSFASMLQACPNLHRLDLVGKPGVTYTVSSIQCINNLTNLSALSLIHLRCSDVHKFPSVLRNCQNLISLTLCNFGMHCPAILEDLLKSLPNLRELRLWQASITISKPLLDSFCIGKKLEKFVLQTNTTSDRGSAFIFAFVKAILSNCPRLHFLALKMPDIRQATHARVKTLVKQLYKVGRRVLVILINPNSIPLSLDISRVPVCWQKTINCDQSYIANYSGYEFVNYF